MNAAQLVMLCIIFLIGMCGFAGTWIALEMQSNSDNNGQSSHRLLGGSLNIPNPSIRSRKNYENIKKQHADDSRRKERISDTAKIASPFLQFSDQAPECHLLESPEEVTITLVTQVSYDRLWMMKHHCDRYRNQQGGVHDQHPMSIAVYSNATLDTILDELREMDCGVADAIQNSGNRAAPVTVSVLDARTHGSWNEFPVNELRNLALSKVKTTHILYIDVDFWPSDNLYETIMGGIESGSADGSGGNEDESSLRIRQELVNDPKLALVIPAFQLWRQCKGWEDCFEDNFPHMEASRTMNGMAHEIIEHKSITIFDPTNKGGHGSTDYDHWFKQNPGSLLDIECLQSNRYEPFVVVRYCKDLPPFQTKFAGYGKNKVTWMMQVIASGYIFSQVGGAYLVHYPHLDSASRQVWNGAAKNTASPILKKESKRGRIDELFVDFKKWLEETIDSASMKRLNACDDAQDDDSKLWVETKPSKVVA